MTEQKCTVHVGKLNQNICSFIYPPLLFSFDTLFLFKKKFFFFCYIGMIHWFLSVQMLTRMAYTRIFWVPIECCISMVTFSLPFLPYKLVLYPGLCFWSYYILAIACDFEVHFPVIKYMMKSHASLWSCSSRESEVLR